MTMNFDTKLEVLKAARERITDKKSWTTKAMARDKNSRVTSASDPKACKWCATGAIKLEAILRGHEDWWSVVAEIQRPRFESVVWVNDMGGHAAILDLFDKTIASLEVLGERKMIRYTE